MDKCSDFMTSPGIVTEPLYYIVKKGLGFLKKDKDYLMKICIKGIQHIFIG